MENSLTCSCTCYLFALSLQNQTKMKAFTQNTVRMNRNSIDKTKKKSYIVIFLTSEKLFFVKNAKCYSERALKY